MQELCWLTLRSPHIYIYVHIFNRVCIQREEIGKIRIYIRLQYKPAATAMRGKFSIVPVVYLLGRKKHSRLKMRIRVRNNASSSLLHNIVNELKTTNNNNNDLIIFSCPSFTNRIRQSAYRQNLCYYTHKGRLVETSSNYM